MAPGERGGDSFAAAVAHPPTHPPSQALLEDRRLRREEENVRAAAARQKEADLQKGLEETQETLRRTTGDYLQLRRVHQREQRRTHEETAALRSRNQQLVSELERMRQAAVEDAEVCAALAHTLARGPPRR